MSKLQPHPEHNREGMIYPLTRPLEETSRPWISNKSENFGFGRCQSYLPLFELTSNLPHPAAKPTRDMNVMNSKTRQSQKPPKRTMNITSSQTEQSSKARMVKTPDPQNQQKIVNPGKLQKILKPKTKKRYLATIKVS